MMQINFYISEHDYDQLTALSAIERRENDRSHTMHDILRRWLHNHRSKMEMGLSTQRDGSIARGTYVRPRLITFNLDDRTTYWYQTHAQRLGVTKEAYMYEAFKRTLRLRCDKPGIRYKNTPTFARS